MDDTIVMSLDVHGNNPVLMWVQLGADYNTVTPAQRSLARTEFLTFIISGDESYLTIDNTREIGCVRTDTYRLKRIEYDESV